MAENNESRWNRIVKSTPFQIFLLVAVVAAAWYVGTTPGLYDEVIAYAAVVGVAVAEIALVWYVLIKPMLKS